MFVYTGGASSAHDQIMKSVTAVTKQQFGGFKEAYGKKYATQEEEDHALVNFDRNVKEMFDKSNLAYYNPGTGQGFMEDDADLPVYTITAPTYDGKGTWTYRLNKYFD